MQSNNAIYVLVEHLELGQQYLILNNNITIFTTNPSSEPLFWYVGTSILVSLANPIYHFLFDSEYVPLLPIKTPNNYPKSVRVCQSKLFSIFHLILFVCGLNLNMPLLVPSRLSYICWRRLSVVPVSVSLAVSYISASIITGTVPIPWITHVNMMSRW